MGQTVSGLRSEDRSFLLTLASCKTSARAWEAVSFSGCGLLQQHHPISLDFNSRRTDLKVFDMPPCDVKLLRCLDLSLSWPPPDPDRIPRPIRTQAHDRGLLFDSSPTIGHDYVEEFRRRQQQDQRRFHRNVSPIARRKPFYGRPQIATGTTAQGRRIAETPNDSSSGEEGWQNIEGERLDDFGVDEKAEFYDEDEIPLAVLRNQRRLQVSESNYPHNQRFA